MENGIIVALILLAMKGLCENERGSQKDRRLEEGDLILNMMKFRHSDGSYVSDLHGSSGQQLDPSPLRKGRDQTGCS